LSNLSKTNNSARDYTDIPPIPETVWQKPLPFIAFGLGSGTIPFAPGTFGTLICVPFYLALQPISTLSYCLITLFVIFASIWICGKVSRDINIQDHQGMCLDEVPGFFVTMIHAPQGWQWVLLGFALFRLFDIWKPWPIRYVDKNIHGGFGMIFDDVLAGVYAFVIMQIIAKIF